MSAVRRTPPPESFDQMLPRLQAMEPGALHDAFRWLSPSVAGYLRLRGSDDPDGLTNEVFLRAFRRIESFTGDGDRFRSWVFSIAHNLLIDEHRKRDRRVTLVPLTTSIDPPEPMTDAETIALEYVGLEQAAVWFSYLTDDQRTVLFLRIIGGLSLKETADALERDVNAVKALQHRAITRLRGLLDPSDVNDTNLPWANC